jgi:uncharacterized membrane protein
MLTHLFFKILLWLHIAAGTIGLCSGTLVMLLPKGNALHRKIGKIFFFGMVAAGFFSLLLALWHSNRFLFIIGVFTLYMTISGKQYIRFRDGNAQPNSSNWFLTAMMLLFGIAFLFLGVQLLARDSFGWVYLSFGAISINFVLQDWANFRGKNASKPFGLLSHLQRMTGAYIASLTAFLVVNVRFLPALVVWLLPTIVITPLIFIWSKKVIRHTFNQGKLP